MPVHHRKTKVVELSFGTDPDNIEVQCQLRTYNLANNSDDGEQVFTLCPDGEFREESDPDWALEVTFVADWRLDGVSDWLQQHGGETVAFALDVHPDIPAEHTRHTGQIKLRRPNVQGEARTTEMTEATFQVIGEPLYTRVEEVTP